MAIKIGGTIVIDDSRNINNVGVITATSFRGDGSQLIGAGVGSNTSINTSGIVTASKVVSNEFEGIGDKLIFSPIITSFNPTDGSTAVSAASFPTISITYSQPVSIGTTGNVVLRKNSATGDIVETFVAGISTRLATSSRTLTITPTNYFDYTQEYYVIVDRGVVINSVGGVTGILSTYNFTTEVGPTLSSASPSSGSTNVSITTNIVFTFNKNIRPGTGTITLRVGSSGGTIIESFNVTSSNRLTFSSNTLTINPTNDLSINTNYYVVIPNGAVGGYAGTSTYNFTTENPALGSVFGGGCLICKSGGVLWVAGQSSTQVCRTWYLRTDASTVAQQVSGCTGWFVPTASQLQNPGFTCRVYWDYGSPHTRYWSDTECTSSNAYTVYFNPSGTRSPNSKPAVYRVRAFRCVTY
jgi:hypothetical protein